MNDQAFGVEIASDQRFQFGRNWARFLETLSDRRIVRAERVAIEMLGVPHLGGKSFLDLGSGSGLSSLVAHQLRTTVHSFDSDSASVACTSQPRNLHADDDRRWQVEQPVSLSGHSGTSNSYGNRPRTQARNRMTVRGSS